VSDRVDQFYRALFRKLNREFGSFEANTRTAVIGFSAGGPVSFSKVVGKSVFATCELSQYPEQVRSVEGLQYEFFTRMRLSEAEIYSLFTGLGALSMQARLGDGHTIDVSVLDGIRDLKVIQLKLYSRSRLRLGRYGVYEVVRVAAARKTRERMRET
jgi:hypothetical protein